MSEEPEQERDAAPDQGTEPEPERPAEETEAKE